MKRKTINDRNTLLAVGYCRVSSARQADEGVSIATQKARIKKWASDNGAKLISIYEDNGISGRSINGRSGFQKALEEVVQNRGVLVCYSLSRLSRSLVDMLQTGAKLAKAGCNLVSLMEQIDTTTAAGKMFFQMLCVLNEFGSNLISEQTKGALEHLRQQEKKTGGIVPFGFDVDQSGKLIKNAKEQKVMGEIIKLHRQGLKFQTIGNHLNEKGIRTKTGKQWFAQTVKNVVLAVNKKGG